METIYFGLIAFLFLLAIFDLTVGVSNDAVNFLNSAIGAKVAKFRTILIISAIGIFVGATMSNGMMDIARHGILQPQMFGFNELMCIFLAVMVTDVVLLDIFNTLGMPTSTTVSLVFELLGGTFILAVLKIAADNTGTVGLGDLINAEKALSVIISIFLSVAIAFIFGTLVQWISRIIFTFNYVKHQKYTIALFGGIATTAIAYFILIKGLKNSPFMNADIQSWIYAHNGILTIYMFIGSTILMQILHLCKINILKIIVLMGTFALAMAFAGNDLVNFIGVPLAGLSAFQDWHANGAGDPGFLMGSLNESARTPILFLVAAGIIMIISLMTSKKAQNVVKTSVDLARQDEGDEMFGSSTMARYIVRKTSNMSETISSIVPDSVKRWIDSRFQKDEAILADGAAFDLVRAAVNLVLAGLLIIMGTSMKLPLSTTYVTFMVAMGSSLADRAWGRESAVFRITGVLSVIGGWFITAGVAFAVCAIVTAIMYYGGTITMIIMILLAFGILIKSNISFRLKQKKESENDLFSRMMRSKDREEVWQLLNKHIDKNQTSILDFTIETYPQLIYAFENESRNDLLRIKRSLRDKKEESKKMNRQELLGMRRIDNNRAIEFNTWYYLGTNNSMQLIYGLIRMIDPCFEHVDNNFNPLPETYKPELEQISDEVVSLMKRTRVAIVNDDFRDIDEIRTATENLQNKISATRKLQYERMHNEDPSNLKISLVYMNILQESQELMGALRHLLRANSKFQGR
jgi:phosphate/sulfate permease